MDNPLESLDPDENILQPTHNLCEYYTIDELNSAALTITNDNYFLLNKNIRI